MTGQNWPLAFLVAGAVALAVMPVVRRVALRTGIVDTPRSHKSHTRTVPYLGGVGIVVGAAIGTFVGPLAGARAALLFGGAALLCAIGLMDDRKDLGALVRLAVQGSVAIGAYVMGIEAVATGVTALDAIVTVVWIVGMANALNLMDNMDGLAAGNAIPVASGIFAIAALGGQVRVATIAIALAGACIGFLAYNARPAAIFMGDAGSLPLGFLLSTLTLQVDPALAPPASFVVPALLLAVPLLDTATVVGGRLRHGLSPFLGGKDHLSHRLVHRGRTREQAVAILVAAQAAFAVLAVLIGRDVIPILPGLGVALVLLVALASNAVRGRMYRNRRRPLPTGVRWAIGAAASVPIVCGAPAAYAMVAARDNVQIAAAAAERGLAAAQAGDPESARPLFAKASSNFGSAGDRLNGPLQSLGLIVPGLSSNLRASRTLVSTGVELSLTGERLAGEADPSRLRVSGGRVDVAEVQRMTPLLQQAAKTLKRGLADVRAVQQPYLVPQIERAVRDLERRLVWASADADRAARTAEVAPALLGANGPRRYFLAVQNNAELRATGGFIGNFGELEANGGKIQLGRFGRIGELNGTPDSGRVLRAPDDFIARYQRFDLANTWQNINLSPDLPAVTRVIADLYPQSGGQPVDGVVAVDPIGLSAILKLTGPVTVAGWPEPITSDNVVDVTLRDAYARFPDQAKRVQFIGDVARKVFETATSTNLGSPPAIARALGDASRGGHLRLSPLDPKESKVAAEIGADGRVPKPRSDSLMLVTQNAAGNKVDYYLKRSVDYDVSVLPLADGKSAAVAGRVVIKLDNGAAGSGLPDSVIGPYDPRFAAGENRLFLSFYTPLGLKGAKLDGERIAVETAKELGRQVYSTFVSIPANGSRTVELELDGSVPLDSSRRYSLDVLQQPLLHPDEVNVRVTPAGGWRLDPPSLLTGAGVAARRDGVAATARFTLASPHSLRFGLKPGATRPLWRRLLSPDPADLAIQTG